MSGGSLCVGCDQRHFGESPFCRECRHRAAEASKPSISHEERADQLAQQSIEAQERIAAALERIADALTGQGDAGAQLSHLAWTAGMELGHGFELGRKA